MAIYNISNNGTIYLTDDQPEFVISIKLSEPDITPFYIQYYETSNTDWLLVNAFDVKSQSEVSTDKNKIILENSLNEALFCLSSIKPSLDDAILVFDINGTITTITIKNKRTNYHTIYNDSFDSINTPNKTRLLLKTNPLLSGNITIGIENNNVYLGSFDNSKLRSYFSKVYLNPNIDLSKSISNILDQRTVDEIYEIPDKLNLTNLEGDVYKQYSTVYEYGAKMNYNKDYDSKYKLFAPLWLGDNIPEYFVIFKVSKYENEFSLKNHINNISDIIKVVDLREQTNIGKIIKQHHSNINNSNSLFIEWKDYGKIGYNGINIKDGVINTIYESFDSLYKQPNLTDFENDVLLGFKRNKLLSSNLLNLEFYFDYESLEENSFSVDYVFGLYVKEYELCSILKGRYSSVTDYVTEIQSNELCYSNLQANIVTHLLADRISIKHDNKSFDLLKETNKSDIIGTKDESGPNQLLFSDNISKVDFSGFLFLNIYNLSQRAGNHFRITEFDSSNNTYNVYDVYTVLNFDQPYVMEWTTIKDETTFNFRSITINLDNVTVLSEKLNHIYIAFNELLNTNENITIEYDNEKEDIIFKTYNSSYEYGLCIVSCVPGDNNITSNDFIIPDFVEFKTNNTIYTSKDYSSSEDIQKSINDILCVNYVDRLYIKCPFIQLNDSQYNYYTISSDNKYVIEQNNKLIYTTDDINYFLLGHINNNLYYELSDDKIIIKLYNNFESGYVKVFNLNTTYFSLFGIYDISYIDSFIDILEDEDYIDIYNINNKIVSEKYNNFVTEIPSGGSINTLLNTLYYVSGTVVFDNTTYTDSYLFSKDGGNISSELGAKVSIIKEYFNYVSESISLNEFNNFNDIFYTKYNTLKHSIINPSFIHWESNDTNILGLNNILTNRRLFNLFITGNKYNNLFVNDFSSKWGNRIGLFSTKTLSESDTYISYDVSNYIFIDNTYLTIREALIKYPNINITNVLFGTKLSGKTRYSVITNDISFCFNGVVYSLSENINDLTYDAKLRTLDNFDVYVLNTKSCSVNGNDIEMFINNKFKCITILVYNYCDKNNHLTNTDKPGGSTSWLVNDKYSFDSTGLLNTNKNFVKNKFHAEISGTGIITEDGMSVPYIQNFYYNPNTALLSNGTDHIVYDGSYYTPYNSQYISQNTSINYTSNISDVFETKMYNDLVQAVSNISFYHTDGDIYNNNIPLILSVNTTSQYKTTYDINGNAYFLQGKDSYYNPKFNDIITFYNNDTPLLQYTLNTSLISCNTLIKNENNINRYWYYRVNKNGIENTINDINNTSLNYNDQKNTFVFINPLQTIKESVINNDIFSENILNNILWLDSFMFGSMIFKYDDIITKTSYDTTEYEITNDNGNISVTFNIDKIIQNHYSKSIIDTFSLDDTYVNAVNEFIYKYINRLYLKDQYIESSVCKINDNTTFELLEYIDNNIIGASHKYVFENNINKYIISGLSSNMICGIKLIFRT